MTSDDNIICKPVTPDLWSDLKELFGKSGAYWGCWCMYWRCSNKEFQQMNSADHKQALHDLVTTSTHVPGILAYVDTKPIGWISFGPREDFTRLVKSRTIKPPDDKPVWSIICFFVHKKFRGSGVSQTLLESAEAYAKSQGALILESYPVEINEKIPDEYAYCGVHQLFSKSGFTKIASTNATSGKQKKVLMRKTL